MLAPKPAEQATSPLFVACSAPFTRKTKRITTKIALVNRGFIDRTGEIMALHALTVPYQAANLLLKEKVAGALQVDSLEGIHDLGPDYELFTRSTDQKTVWHERFYEYVDTSEWQEAYTKLVDEVASWVGEPVVYQRVPTFRVAFPDNLAVGEWHRDKDYNHSEHEINAWVPLTDAYDTQTVWCESTEGAEDYAPLNCAYGKVLMFDGANLKHGNKPNTSGSTRVSFDFRLIPLRHYDDSNFYSINTKLPFRLPRFEGEQTYYAKAEA